MIELLLLTLGYITILDSSVYDGMIHVEGTVDGKLVDVDLNVSYKGSYGPSWVKPDGASPFSRECDYGDKYNQLRGGCMWSIPMTDNLASVNSDTDGSFSIIAGYTPNDIDITYKVVAGANEVQVVPTGKGWGLKDGAKSYSNDQLTQDRFGELLAKNVFRAQSAAVPEWFKNTAGWWADNRISNKEFVNASEWLVKNKIMVIE